MLELASADADWSSGGGISGRFANEFGDVQPAINAAIEIRPKADRLWVNFSVVSSLSDPRTIN